VTFRIWFNLVEASLNPGGGVLMRKTFPHWTHILMFLLSLASLPIMVVSANQGEGLFEDPYPTPEVITQVSGNMEKSVGLILGAALIVLVIFGGVIIRRIKS
jgi:hypothetical protein